MIRKEHVTPTNGLLLTIAGALIVQILVGASKPYFADPEQQGRFLTQLEHIIETANENRARIDAHDQIGWHYKARESSLLQQQRIETLESAMGRVLNAIKTNADIGIKTQELLHAIAGPTQKKPKELQ